MGIPKNYQNKVNLENRVKALNEVNFYMVECEYTPKEGGDKVTSTIEVNALSEEQMEKKFDKIMFKQNISNYKILSYQTSSFSDRINNLGLDSILNPN
jgi:hypothetical protein